MAPHRGVYGQHKLTLRIMKEEEEEREEEEGKGKKRIFDYREPGDEVDLGGVMGLSGR